MTEEEWLACGDPVAALVFLRGRLDPRTVRRPFRRFGDRQLRRKLLLFAGHGQGRPAPIVRHGGSRRTHARLEDQALELPTHECLQSRGGGASDQVLQLRAG